MSGYYSGRELENLLEVLGELDILITKLDMGNRGMIGATTIFNQRHCTYFRD